MYKNLNSHETHSAKAYLLITTLSVHYLHMFLKKPKPWLHRYERNVDNMSGGLPTVQRSFSSPDNLQRQAVVRILSSLVSGKRLQWKQGGMGQVCLDN